MIVKGKVTQESTELTAIDVLLDSWSDFILVFNYSLGEDDLIKSLEATLDLAPIVSGRKYTDENNIVYITGANNGIDFEFLQYDHLSPGDACVHNSDKQKYLPDNQTKHKHLLSKTSIKHALLKIKVTSYTDVTILGLSIWHPLADGFSFITFLQLWAGSFCKKNVTAIHPHRFNISNAVETSVSEAAFDISQRGQSWDELKDFEEACFIIPKKIIKKESSRDGDYTESDILISFLWKKIAVVISASEAEELLLIPVYNVRSIYETPTDYFGNYLYFAKVALTKREIAGVETTCLAEKIRESSFKIFDDFEFYTSKILSLRQHHFVKNKSNYILKPIYEATFGKGIFVNNLSSFPFSSIDFGRGGPIFIDCPLQEKSRFITILPSLTDAESYHIKINLPQEEMNELKSSLIHYKE